MDVKVTASAIHGTGVFALREFRMGETVLIIDDSREVNDEHPLRIEAGEFPWHQDYFAIAEACDAAKRSSPAFLNSLSNGNRNMLHCWRNGLFR